ncbi:MAG: putative DNA-binding domain-containing protein [Gammaproteobacteria bacterium]|nr:putative DNA-binding domain-containing protein [Gammaproteobacteria bacterium]
MAKADFKQIQYAFTAHLRDPANNPAPEGIEDRRIGIYRELLYNNIEGFLSRGFPVIRSIYNDDNWHCMVRDFFSRHKSQSPYFLEISQEFLSYLQNERVAQPEDPAGLLELAHYEWVELALNVADEQITLDGINANGDLLQGHPVLSPLAWSLAYQFPVHKMAPDYLPEKQPEQPTYLVVYRNRNDKVKFMEINPVTARLIHLLEENNNLSGQQALQQIAQEMNHPKPEVVINGGLSALQELQSYGIILGTAYQ